LYDILKILNRFDSIIAAIKKIKAIAVICTDAVIASIIAAIIASIQGKEDTFDSRRHTRYFT